MTKEQQDTIDKVQFKVTIPTIVTIVLCTGSIISMAYNSKVQSLSSDNEIKSQLQQLKSNQEVFSITTQNSLKIISNSIKRDSTDRVIGFNSLHEELQDVKETLNRSYYNHKLDISSNE